MKTLHFVLFTLFLLFFAVPAQAQVEIGVIGSVNFATISGEDLDGEALVADRRTLYGVGGVLEVRLNEHWSLRTEPMYLQKGTQNIDGDQVSYKAEYLEVPLFLKLSLGSGSARPYVMAGPSIGFRLSSELSVEDEEISGTFDANEVTESVDFGIDFGAGLSLRLNGVSFFVEGRYDLGVADFFTGGEVGGQLTDDVNVFTRGLQAMAGITIPLVR